MINALASFFGFIIRIIYGLVNNNYFVTIILFTILTKILLFPLTWMQIKSTEKLNKIAPLDTKIREKYKNDKQKQAEELSKLYSENRINPLGGCIPVLIQFPIIIAMFYIVKYPLTYVKPLQQEEIVAYTKEVLQKDEVTDSEVRENQLVVAKEKEIINMDVIKGINLGEVPANVFNKNENKKAHPLSLIIPVLTVVFSIMQSNLVQKNSNMTEEQKEMQKSMNMTMPILSGFIAYTMPLALGIYWLFGNILQIIQQLIVNKIISKDKEKLALNSK